LKPSLSQNLFHFRPIEAFHRQTQGTDELDGAVESQGAVAEDAVELCEAEALFECVDVDGVWVDVGRGAVREGVASSADGKALEDGHVVLLGATPGPGHSRRRCTGR